MALVFLLINYIEKYNHVIRFALIPFALLLTLIGIAAFANNALALLALFWNHDASSNIWFYSNILVPGFTSYVMMGNVYAIAPTYKLSTTLIIGSLWVALYLFIGYVSLKTGTPADGNFLYDYFDVGTSLFGTVLLVISSIAGVYFAVKNARDGF